MTSPSVAPHPIDEKGSLSVLSEMLPSGRVSSSVVLPFLGALSPSLRMKHCDVDMVVVGYPLVSLLHSILVALYGTQFLLCICFV